MGAWGMGNFENDSALDWTFELADAKNLSVLERAFSAVADSEYADAHASCSALAAAEVVAALLKKPAAYLPEEVESFIDRIKMEPSPSLVRLAKQSVQRIKSDSELKELWEEGEDLAAWARCVDELLTRLN